MVKYRGRGEDGHGGGLNDAHSLPPGAAILPPRAGLHLHHAEPPGRVQAPQVSSSLSRIREKLVR